MNIAFSTFVMQGGRSGVAAYIVNLLKHLQTVDTKNDYDLLVARSEEQLLALTNPRFHKSVFPSWLAKPVPNIAWHNLALPLRARRRYDLVHIPSYRRIPWLKGARTVATVHDLATFHIEGKYDRARMAYNRRVVPALIRSADHVITVSRFTRDDVVRLIGYPEERITVIHSGIDHAVYRPVPRAEAQARLLAKYGLDAPFLVFVSRIEHPGQNHVRLIRAFEALKRAEPSPHKLVLVGADWSGAPAVHACARDSRVAADIVFAGFAPIADLPDFYSACDLAVYPSLFEGFGFPIVEAMACGAPAICSRSSSMIEIAQDRLDTFAPESEEEIRAALARALRREWAEEDRARGRAYAATFDWDRTARQVIEVYEKVGGR